LPPDGPPFDLWSAPTKHVGVYRPVVDPVEDPIYDAPGVIFFVPTFFTLAKRGEENEDGRPLGVMFYLFFYICFVC